MDRSAPTVARHLPRRNSGRVILLDGHRGRACRWPVVYFHQYGHVGGGPAGPALLAGGRGHCRRRIRRRGSGMRRPAGPAPSEHNEAKHGPCEPGRESRGSGPHTATAHEGSPFAPIIMPLRPCATHAGSPVAAPPSVRCRGPVPAARAEPPGTASCCPHRPRGPLPAPPAGPLSARVGQAPALASAATPTPASAGCAALHIYSEDCIILRASASAGGHMGVRVAVAGASGYAGRRAAAADLCAPRSRAGPGHRGGQRGRPGHRGPSPARHAGRPDLRAYRPGPAGHR